MSKIKIERELKKKGLKAELEFVRGDVTPGGYASGWEIELDDESEDKLFDAGFRGDDKPDCRNVTEVLEWIKDLPDCRN